MIHQMYGFEYDIPVVFENVKFLWISRNLPTIAILDN